MKYQESIRWRVALGTMCLVLTQTHAQSFPGKPIKLLVGVTPGGTTDALARFLAQEMQEDCYF